MAAAGRGPAAELRGVLLPPRRDPRGSEDGDSEEEEEEEAEEELLLAEAALLEDAGRKMAATLPPRRAGEGRRGAGGSLCSISMSSMYSLSPRVPPCPEVGAQLLLRGGLSDGVRQPRC